VILDSSYLFDLLAADEDAFRKGTELADSGEIQWLPTPVVMETYYGAMTARSGTTEAEIRSRLLGYPRVDIDDEMARAAAALLASADDEAGGDSGVGPQDAYIAAVADVFDDRVLTDNVEDFRTLGVPVEPY
jgi:predicted nucleic acid-binding protein